MARSAPVCTPDRLQRNLIRVAELTFQPCSQGRCSESPLQRPAFVSYLWMALVSWSSSLKIVVDITDDDVKSSEYPIGIELLPAITRTS